VRCRFRWGARSISSPDELVSSDVSAVYNVTWEPCTFINLEVETRGNCCANLQIGIMAWLQSQVTADIIFLIASVANRTQQCSQ
jgi:hypothetical protein